MGSRQIRIFNDKNDFESILSIVEAEYSLRYYKTGQFEVDIIPHYDSLLTKEGLGFADADDSNLIESFLAQPKDIGPVFSRVVMQRNGSQKFVIDLLQNPTSIEVKPGGITRKYENVIIAGRIGIVSDNQKAVELFKAFERAIKKEFEKVGAFYVGPSAFEKMIAGWRLVMNANSPKEYDLK